MFHFLPNTLAPHFLKQPDCLLSFVSKVSFDTEIPLCVAAKALLLHGERKDACCLSPLLIVHYVGKVTAGSLSTSERRGSEARELSPPLMSSWQATLCASDLRLCVPLQYVRLLQLPVCTSIVSQVKGKQSDKRDSMLIIVSSLLVK